MRRVAGVAMWSIAVGLGAGVLVAGCSSSSTDPDVPGTLGPGKWGGPSVGLTVTATEAAAHFDFCAEGTLTVPILLTPDGRFDVPGTYVRNIGPSIAAKSARYIGLWRPSLVTLTVILSDPLGPNESTIVGPFDMQPDRPGPAVKPCPIVY